jgi:hypothetical protein
MEHRVAISVTSLRDSEKSSVLIEGIAKAIRKAGIHRDVVFTPQKKGKKVYAYSIYPADPTKIVREDSNGRKKVGRLVGGKFRAQSSKPL